MAPVGTPQGMPLLSPAMLGHAAISSVRLGSVTEDAGTDARGPQRNPPHGPLRAGAPALPGGTLNEEHGGRHLVAGWSVQLCNASGLRGIGGPA